MIHDAFCAACVEKDGNSFYIGPDLAMSGLSLPRVVPAPPMDLAECKMRLTEKWPLLDFAVGPVVIMRAVVDLPARTGGTIRLDGRVQVRCCRDLLWCWSSCASYGGGHMELLPV